MYQGTLQWIGMEETADRLGRALNVNRDQLVPVGE